MNTTVYRHGMWRRCLRCQDALPKLTCSVCMVTKGEDAFNAKHRENVKNEGDALRCIECETCKECGETQKYHRSFSSETKYRHLCIKCVPKSCFVCNRILPKGAFSKQLHSRHMSHRAGRLRCNDCMVCKQCGKAQEHAQKFSTRHNYQQLCLACEPLQCTKCSRAQPRNVFPPCAVRHSRREGRTQPLLCMSCRSAGCSARNLDAYPCRACHHSYGHSRFKEDDIRKYKNADNVSKKKD